MQKYLNYVTTQSGAILTGVTVTVYLGGTSTIATIYSDNGVTTQANPFVNNSSDASVTFYAANGVYDIVFAKTNFTFSATETAGVRLFDPQNLVLSVKDAPYYAKGDGVTNDTAAFTSAGNGSGNIEVHVPTGTYLLNSNPTPTGTVTWILHAGASTTGVGVLPGRKIIYGVKSTLDISDDGTATVYTNPGLNFLQTESYAAGTGNFHMGLAFQLTRTNGTGNRNALNVNMNSAGAAAGEFMNGGQFNGHITSGSGSVFGLNPYAWIDSGVATTAEAVGLEADTDIRNVSVNRKVGIQIIDVATSTAGGTTFDAGLVIAKQVGGLGYKNGIQFGLAATQGLQTTSTLISAPYAFTVSNGIDLSALTISTNAFKSPGFILSGTGVTSIGSPTVGQTFSLGVKQVVNGQVGLFLQRFTDTAPTGNLFQVTNAANNVVLAYIDTAGVVQGSILQASGVAATVGAGIIAYGGSTSTTATAGANGAVPAQVAGYIIINVAGTAQKIPYFNT